MSRHCRMAGFLSILKMDGMIPSVKNRLAVEVEGGVQAGTGGTGGW